MAKMVPRHSDYFVYKVNPHRSKLDLLPNPCPVRFSDSEVAVLSCGDGKYAVATLQLKLFSEFTFMLHLYRSKPDGDKPGSWTS
ncbi:hypothetical protein BAE44_0017803 [Dichanthelium oligosanthes]|uniref:Uncharacterized protein n=1 Tax=Dichanthelium oligosanthes TaxID=888268 RepID=A0A1E5V7T5_9POAL|nr:hypothetical protein BAE44_0017803 [Dichanthelium oligosanthes]